MTNSINPIPDPLPPGGDILGIGEQVEQKDSIAQAGAIGNLSITGAEVLADEQPSPAAKLVGQLLQEPEFRKLVGYIPERNRDNRDAISVATELEEKIKSGSPDSVQIFFDWVGSGRGDESSRYRATVNQLVSYDRRHLAYPSDVLAREGNVIYTNGPDRSLPDAKKTVFLADPSVDGFDENDGGCWTHYRRTEQDPNVWVAYSDGVRGHRATEQSLALIQLLNVPSDKEAAEAQQLIGDFDSRIGTKTTSLVDSMVEGEVPAKNLWAMWKRGLTRIGNKNLSALAETEFYDLRKQKTYNGQTIKSMILERTKRARSVDKLKPSTVLLSHESGKRAVEGVEIDQPTTLIAGSDHDTRRGSVYTSFEIVPEAKGVFNISNTTLLNRLQQIGQVLPNGVYDGVSMPGDQVQIEALSSTVSDRLKGLFTRTIDVSDGQPVTMTLADLSHLELFVENHDYGDDELRQTKVTFNPNGTVNVEANSDRGIVALMTKVKDPAGLKKAESTTARQLQEHKKLNSDWEVNQKELVRQAELAKNGLKSRLANRLKTSKK
jgi:hypothetical protein